MGLTFNYSRDSDIGIVLLFGDPDLNESMKAWTEFHSAIQQDHLKALLIKDRTNKKIEIPDIIHVVKWITEIGFPQDVKVALVDYNGSKDTNLNNFGGSLISERGWSNIKIFTDEAKAMSWLKSQAD